MWKAE